MVTASFRIVGLLCVLVTYICKAEAGFCSCVQEADIIAEIRKEVFDAIINQTEVISKTRCPDTWISFQGSCYLFSKTKVNFYDAELICSSHGAHLVYVHSEKENTFLKSHIRELKGSDYWMGLTDSVTEGVFLWYDTDVPTSFADWAPGEPTNSGANEHCADFYSPLNNAWNDAPCAIANNFVCEMELI